MTAVLDLDERIWVWAGNLCYALAFLFVLSCVLRSKKHSRPVLLSLVGAGFVLQTAGLYLRGIQVGSCPLGNPFEIVQFVVWSLIVVYMAVGPAFRMSLLGFFSSGLAAFLGILSLAVSEWDETRRESLFGPNVWVELHAALAIFSYGIFGILALTSLMYLLQNYSLKHKRLRGVFGFLPSLFQIEQMNFRLLFLGLAILTVSLLMGSAYWLQDPESVRVGKLLATMIVWAAYITVFGLRIRQSLVSRGLAWTCIALFLVALLSLPRVDAGPKVPKTETTAPGADLRHALFHDAPGRHRER